MAAVLTTFKAETEALKHCLHNSGCEKEWDTLKSSIKQSSLQLSRWRGLQALKIMTLCMDSVVALRNLMELFVKEVSDVITSEKVVDNEQLSSELLVILKDFWALCSNQHSVITNYVIGNFKCELYDVLPSMASIYIDLFVAANRSKDKTPVLSKRMFAWLNFELNTRCMKTALLEVSDQSSVAITLLLPTLKKVLMSPPPKKSPVDYLLHFTLLRRWALVTSDLNDVIQTNLEVKAPCDFVTWLKHRWAGVSSHLPQDKSLKGRRVSELICSLDAQAVEELIDVFSECLWSGEEEKTESVVAEESISQDLFVIDKTGAEKNMDPPTKRLKLKETLEESPKPPKQIINGVSLSSKSVTVPPNEGSLSSNLVLGFTLDRVSSRKRTSSGGEVTSAVVHVAENERREEMEVDGDDGKDDDEESGEDGEKEGNDIEENYVKEINAGNSGDEKIAEKISKEEGVDCEEEDEDGNDEKGEEKSDDVSKNIVDKVSAKKMVEKFIKEIAVKRGSESEDSDEEEDEDDIDFIDDEEEETEGDLEEDESDEDFINDDEVEEESEMVEDDEENEKLSKKKRVNRIEDSDEEGGDDKVVENGSDKDDGRDVEANGNIGYLSLTKEQAVDTLYPSDAEDPAKGYFMNAVSNVAEPEIQVIEEIQSSSEENNSSVKETQKTMPGRIKKGDSKGENQSASLPVIETAENEGDPETGSLLKEESSPRKKKGSNHTTPVVEISLKEHKTPRQTTVEKAVIVLEESREDKENKEKDGEMSESSDALHTRKSRRLTGLKSEPGTVAEGTDTDKVGKEGSPPKSSNRRRSSVASAWVKLPESEQKEISTTDSPRKRKPSISENYEKIEKSPRKRNSNTLQGDIEMKEAEELDQTAFENQPKCSPRKTRRKVSESLSGMLIDETKDKKSPVKQGAVGQTKRERTASKFSPTKIQMTEAASETSPNNRRSKQDSESNISQVILGDSNLGTNDVKSASSLKQKKDRRSESPKKQTSPIKKDNDSQQNETTVLMVDDESEEIKSFNEKGSPKKKIRVSPTKKLVVEVVDDEVEIIEETDLSEPETAEKIGCILSQIRKSLDKTETPSKKSTRLRNIAGGLLSSEGENSSRQSSRGRQSFTSVKSKQATQSAKVLMGWLRKTPTNDDRVQDSSSDGEISFKPKALQNTYSALTPVKSPMTLLTQDKATTLTPSKATMSTPAKVTTLTPRKAAVSANHSSQNKLKKYFLRGASPVKSPTAKVEKVPVKNIQEVSESTAVPTDPPVQVAPQKSPRKSTADRKAPVQAEPLVQVTVQKSPKKSTDDRKAPAQADPPAQVTPQKSPRKSPADRRKSLRSATKRR